MLTVPLNTHVLLVGRRLHAVSVSLHVECSAYPQLGYAMEIPAVRESHPGNGHAVLHKGTPKSHFSRWTNDLPGSCMWIY